MASEASNVDGQEGSDDEECELSFLQMQLDEIQLLQAMYPDHKDFELDDPQVLTSVETFLGKCGSLGKRPPCIAFTLRLKVQDENDSKENVVEMWCSFPNGYPRMKPLINIRSQAFSRESQRRCSTRVLQYMDDLDTGEPVSASLVQWIYEHAAEYFCAAQTSGRLGPSRSTSVCSEQFCRIWLYMHHIYNKHKRKVILEWAQELKLTGFCLPGKPGVVCAEGDIAMVDEYFHRLRRMNWKRITCRHREEQDGDVDSLRLFADFPELNFDAHGGHHNHMNMGLFYQFLQEHHKPDMFAVLFGVEGRSS